MANVELVVEEVLRQRIKQLRIRRRIAQGEVVHRIDDADPEVMAPDAVDETAGKERVIRLAQPVPQFDAEVLARFLAERRSGRSLGSEGLASVRVGELRSGWANEHFANRPHLVV